MGLPLLAWMLSPLPVAARGVSRGAGALLYSALCVVVIDLSPFSKGFSSMPEPISTDCTVTELAEKLAKGDDFILLDVRMDEELAIAKIGEPTHIVLQELPDRLEELDDARTREIVVMCHHGGRSAMARDFLLDSGFSHVRNLVGGIDAYAASVDPGMPRY